MDSENSVKLGNQRPNEHHLDFFPLKHVSFNLKNCMQGIYFLFTGTSQHHQHLHSGTGIGGSSHAMVSSAVMEDSRSMSPSLLALLTAHASSSQVSFLGGRKKISVSRSNKQSVASKYSGIFFHQIRKRELLSILNEVIMRENACLVHDENDHFSKMTLLRTFNIYFVEIREKSNSTLPSVQAYPSNGSVTDFCICLSYERN